MCDRSVKTAAAEASTASRNVRVLLIDDQTIIVEAVRRLLDGEKNVEFRAVQNAENALPTALEWKPTVVLQDLVMPGTDGFALVEQFRRHPDMQCVPIVVLTTKEDPHIKAQSFAIGANDYLVKLPDRLELLARLRYHSGAYISRMERDEAFRALRESERQLAEANVQLQRLAEIDGLTGIANRRRFDDMLASEWQRAQRTQRPLSLLLCDIDYFKIYNDTYGHLAGDHCLKKVASVLSDSLRRPADLAARYGGEEFTLILPETDIDGALLIAEACRSHVDALVIPNLQLLQGTHVTISIGVASMVPVPGNSNPSELIDSADRALYQAKERGRNQVAWIS